MNENAIEGRNAVLEAFRAGKTVDKLYVQEGLVRLNLSVRVGTKLNRADLVTGKQALILPCLGRSEHDRRASGEQFIITENSMGVVEQSRGRRRPVRLRPGGRRAGVRGPARTGRPLPRAAAVADPRPRR